MFRFLRKDKKLTIERQLRNLQKAGIRPRTGLEMSEFIKFRHEAFEADPYKLLLIALGGVTHANEPVSDNVWYLELDSIRRTGDYTAIAERMRDLAQGSLPITQLSDHIDAAQNLAWLQFELDGSSQRWELSLHERRVDPTLLARFAELLRLRQPAKGYALLNLYGHAQLIACCTEVEWQKLRDMSGLPFEWLGSRPT